MLSELMEVLVKGNEDQTERLDPGDYQSSAGSQVRATDDISALAASLGSAESAPLQSAEKPQKVKSDVKPARCAHGHALGAFTVDSPPPEGTRCSDCGAEYDPTRKRAPRKAVKQASAMVPVAQPEPEPAPPPSAADRLKAWLSLNMSAERVSKRMDANGPAVKALVFDPFVVPPIATVLIDAGVDPSGVVIEVGDSKAPQTVTALDLWSQSCSRIAGAFVPGDGAAGHPLVREALLCAICTSALVGAVREAKRRPVTGEKTEPVRMTMDLTRVQV